MLDIEFDPTNSNIIYIAGVHGCNGVWKSIDGGANWIRTPTPNCDTTSVEVNPNNPNIVYAAEGRIYKSIDGGQSWNTVWDDYSSGITGLAIDPFNSNIVYASGNQGIYKSSDHGENWALISGSPIVSAPTLITDPVRPNTIYGGVYRSTDSGASWQLINNNFRLPQQYRSIALQVSQMPYTVP